MSKKNLSERDICTQYVTPHLVTSGWDLHSQVREEVGFTDGRIYVRGKLHARGARKRADSRAHAAHLLQAVLKEAFSTPASDESHPGRQERDLPSTLPTRTEEKRTTTTSYARL